MHVQRRVKTASNNNIWARAKEESARGQSLPGDIY